MIDETNPAGRLHSILSEAKRSNEKQKVREVWSRVTGAEVDDVEVTKAVVELYSLSQEIQSLIKMNGGLNHDLYLASFKRLDQAFFPLNLSGPWQGPKQHLTDEALTRLQFCAEELGKFYSEESLPEEDLADVVSKTELLFEAVYSSSLPDTLRLALLEEVERVRHSICLYKIKGAKGLKEALQSTIGAVVANEAELRELSETNPDVLRRLGELIDKLDSFTSRALKLKRALAHPVKFLLEKLTEEKDDQPGEEDEQA